MKVLRIVLVLIILLFSFCSNAQEYNGLRDYEGIELSRGTFFSVINLQEVSSLYTDPGTKIEFLSTTNLYLNEINVVPKNTKFYGYVDEIREPVVGTNAAMRVKVVKMVFPDGYEIPMRGYLYTSRDNFFGGEKTSPASYIKKRSRMQGLPSRVGYVPGPALKMGEHVTIASGANLIVVLVAPVFITHTVTN